MVRALVVAIVVLTAGMTALISSNVSDAMIPWPFRTAEVHPPHEREAVSASVGEVSTTETAAIFANSAVMSSARHSPMERVASDQRGRKPAEHKSQSVPQAAPVAADRPRQLQVIHVPQF